MDGWLLTFDGYDPADESRREALCTLGNGVFATRGAMPECAADGAHHPGTYAAGFYDRLVDTVDGVRVENESMVNLPDWLSLGLAVDGTWFDPDDPTPLLEHHQRLDLRHGVLTRSFRFVDAAGRTTRVVQRRVVHMGRPHLAALETTVTPEDWSGELKVRSGIEGVVENSGVDRYRRLSGRHLVVREHGAQLDTVHLLAEAVTSRLLVAVAARTRVLRDGQQRAVRDRHLLREGGAVHDEFVVDVEVGVPVVVDKVVSLFTSRDPAISDPLSAALTELHDAPGFDVLLRSHAAAWERLWHLFEIDLLDPDPSTPDDILRNVRLGLFHLLQTVSPHTRELDAGLPARGLHGEAYRGHVFWDELFVIPSLALHLPGLARSLLLYRHRRLPAARRAARSLRCRGACFPWQSGSDGREESQRLHLNPESGHWLPDLTHRQRHVGLAVALSTWRYYEATGDIDFLCDYGADLILETTTFFADLVHFDVARQRFVLTGVVGPDEYHTGYPGSEGKGIDNNAYTNVMTAWLAETALRVLRLLPEARRRDLLHELDLTAADLARWRKMTTRMYVPFDDGRISQFEGYDGLAELDWEDLASRHGDVRRLDRVLESEGRSVNGFKASKQADVLMLFYVLSVDELAAVLDGLGYDFDRGSVPDLLDYYLARTSHGSTLSSVVHAWVLARAHRDLAMRFLLEVVRSDVVDVQGGTTAEGVHLAAMIGGSDLLLRCFAGVEARLDGLHVDPAWPSEMGTLVTHLCYRGHEIDLRIDEGGIRLASGPGIAAPVDVHTPDGVHRLEAGGRLETRLAPAAPVPDEAVPAALAER